MSTSVNTNPCIEGQIENSQTKIAKGGFKPSEYGFVPNEWDVCKLGEIAHIYSGGTPNRKVPEYWDGHVPWVTTTLIDGVIIDNALEFITEKGVEFSSTRWCKAGTLLMAMYGQGKTRGKVGMLGFDATINQACAAIDLKDKESSKYLFHVLNSMYEKIRESSNSGGQENLSGTIIKGLSVPLPPKEEQTAIANALSDVDALIQELEKLIAKKQAIKTATMQQLLTGRTRLPQFAHHPDGRKKGYKPSELGEIPEDWEVLPSSSAIEFFGGYGFSSRLSSSSGIKWLKIANVGLNEIKWESDSYLPESLLADFEDFQLSKNDVVMALTRPILNEKLKIAKLQPSDLPSLLNQRVAKLVAKKDNDLNYIYHIVQRADFIAQMNLAMAGTDPPNIGTQALGKIRVLVPEPSEQTAIANILSDMDEDIQSLDQRLHKTRQIKQGMMQELLTGKTRLVKQAGAA